MPLLKLQITPNKDSEAEVSNTQAAGHIWPVRNWFSQASSSRAAVATAPQLAFSQPP